MRRRGPSIVDLQDREERLLRHLDRADLLHALLARLLLLEQLLLAGDVAAVAFCQHVLAQRLDVLARDDVGADGGLDRHVVHLARDLLAHLGRHRAAAVLALGAVDDHRQRVHALAVDQDVDLDHVGGPVLLELVVHRCIAAADALELVEEVQHDLAQRHVVGEHDLLAVVRHVELHAALLVGERHHGAHVFLRHVEMHRHDGLASPSFKKVR